MVLSRGIGHLWHGNRTTERRIGSSSPTYAKARRRVSALRWRRPWRKMMKIQFRRVRQNARDPQYMSGGAAGADLHACLDSALQIQPGTAEAVPTGIAFEIPEGFAGFVFARSGLSSRKGLAPANKVGVIDSDYRGEVTVYLYNQSAEVQTVEPGERVAQIVFMPVVRADFSEADTLSPTPRGAGGFGSTGV